jgi:hypothetical protein
LPADVALLGLATRARFEGRRPPTYVALAVAPAVAALFALAALAEAMPGPAMAG